MASKAIEKILSMWLLPVEVTPGKLFFGEYSVQLATCLLTSSKEDIKLLKLPVLGRSRVEHLAVAGHEALRKKKAITADDGVKQAVPGNVSGAGTGSPALQSPHDGPSPGWLAEAQIPAPFRDHCP